MATAPPRFKSRIAGVFYLLTFLTGAPLAVVSGRLVVWTDAGKTAANILAHPSLFWMAFVSGLIVLACYVVVTALFYELFKPVEATTSLTAAFFSLTGIAIQALSSAFYAIPMVLLRDAPFASVFSVEPLQALMLLFLKLNVQAYNVGLVFFGFYCLLIGYLAFKSTFLPPILGVLMIIAGIGWLTFLVPPLARSLAPFNFLPGVIGEGALTLWLLVMGVNVQRWRPAP